MRGETRPQYISSWKVTSGWQKVFRYFYSPSSMSVPSVNLSCKNVSASTEKCVPLNVVRHWRASEEEVNRGRKRWKRPETLQQTYKTQGYNYIMFIFKYRLRLETTYLYSKMTKASVSDLKHVLTFWSVSTGLFCRWVLSRAAPGRSCSQNKVPFT